MTTIQAPKAYFFAPRNRRRTAEPRRANVSINPSAFSGGGGSFALGAPAAPASTTIKDQGGEDVVMQQQPVPGSQADFKFAVGNPAVGQIKLDFFGERGNPEFNSNMPIGGENVPYKPTTGFGGALRRLFGDDSNKMNLAAQQQQGAQWAQQSALADQQAREDAVTQNEQNFRQALAKDEHTFRQTEAQANRTFEETQALANQEAADARAVRDAATRDALQTQKNQDDINLEQVRFENAKTLEQKRAELKPTKPFEPIKAIGDQLFKISPETGEPISVFVPGQPAMLNMPGKPAQWQSLVLPKGPPANTNAFSVWPMDPNNPNWRINPNNSNKPIYTR
jgi:hypothetical protein